MLGSYIIRGIFLLLPEWHNKPMKYRKLVIRVKRNIKSLKSDTPQTGSCWTIQFRQLLTGTVLALLLMAWAGPTRLFAQEEEDIDPMPVRLKAQVLNLDDEMPVPFAFVLNHRTHSGVTTDEQGRFTMDMLNIDSLSISSLGFSKTTVRIPANYNEMNVLLLYAKPIRFAIPEVRVQGDQKKVNLDGVPPAKKMDIDPQLRGDAYNEKPPVIAALFNPVSFLQYHTSKREREKRETRQAILTEKQWDILSKYYTKELVMELTGLSDPEADKLMIYINSKGLLSYMSTEYDVRTAIKEQFKIYRQEGH